MSKLMQWAKAKMFRLPGMITCAEAEDFIVDYIEGDLPKTKQVVFERHLSFCRECRDYLAAYRASMALGKAVFEDPDADASGIMPEDLVQAILDARSR